jgi:hypothetical protein
MSPYLLFGFVAGGVLSVYLSPAWVERNLGQQRASSVLKAALFGVPLPLCSCSVIPVSVAIRKQGASRGATTAFLLSTPQTGVDSIAVTYALLGPVFAVFRPLTALVSGLIGGALVQIGGGPDTVDLKNNSDHKCAEGSDCCQTHAKGSRLRQILTYSLETLPRDIGVALLVGILIAGVLSAVVPPDYLAAYVGGGIVSMLLLMAIGVPVYVCATGSVPIAIALMHMGASPGAVLAFLIAGPATNAAGLGAVWKVLGGRAVLLYLLTVALSAVGFGLLLDLLLPWIGSGIPEMVSGTHTMEEGGWIDSVSAVVLLAVLGWAYLAPKMGWGHSHDGCNSESSSELVQSTIGTVSSPGCCHDQSSRGDEGGSTNHT